MPDSSSVSETEEKSARARRRSATRRVFLRLCGTTLAAGLGVAADAHVIEPYAIETTRHDAWLPDLPPDLDGMTIAHITDLHRGPVTPDHVLRQALRIVRDVAPDLVAFTGDFVDSQPPDAVQLAAMIREEWAGFKPEFGLWGVLGNHDYGVSADEVAAAIEKAGVRILRNASARAAKGLYVAGIEDTLNGEPDHAAALARVPESGAATLFLTHNPTGVFGVARRKCLALAGHTHGGQVRIPGMAPHLPPGMDGFPLVAGWGIFDQARLYVNRGVGMVALPIRFRCRPEVALITLRRGDTPPKQLPGLTEKAIRKATRAARRALHAMT
jgi:predicted MPP superfamily phosphohydrolase